MGNAQLWRSAVLSQKRTASTFPALDQGACATHSYTVRDTLTISLPGKTKRLVERAASESGLTTSEYVRQAIFHELWRQATLDSRRRAVPAARSLGVFTDEDVFRLIS